MFVFPVCQGVEPPIFFFQKENGPFTVQKKKCCCPSSLRRGANRGNLCRRTTHKTLALAFYRQFLGGGILLFPRHPGAAWVVPGLVCRRASVPPHIEVETFFNMGVRQQGGDSSMKPRRVR